MKPALADMRQDNADCQLSTRFMLARVVRLFASLRLSICPN